LKIFSIYFIFFF